MFNGTGPTGRYLRDARAELGPDVSVDDPRFGQTLQRQMLRSGGTLHNPDNLPTPWLDTPSPVAPPDVASPAAPQHLAPLQTQDAAATSPATPATPTSKSSVTSKLSPKRHLRRLGMVRRSLGRL